MDRHEATAVDRCVVSRGVARDVRSHRCGVSIALLPVVLFLVGLVQLTRPGRAGVLALRPLMMSTGKDIWALTLLRR